MERPFSEVKKEVLEFFRVRYQNFLLDKGYPFDVVEAVFSISFDELLDVQGRIDALKRGKGMEGFRVDCHWFQKGDEYLKRVILPKKRSTHLSFLNLQKRTSINPFSGQKIKLNFI